MTDFLIFVFVATCLFAGVWLGWGAWLIWRNR